MIREVTFEQRCKRKESKSCENLGLYLAWETADVKALRHIWYS